MLKGHDHGILDRQVVIALSHDRSDKSKSLIKVQSRLVRCPHFKKGPPNVSLTPVLEGRQDQVSGYPLAPPRQFRSKVQYMQFIGNDPADYVPDDRVGLKR
jgi:hypothetical protein